MNIVKMMYIDVKIVKHYRRVKIIDFGLARRLPPGQASLPVTVCGTPEFIAPEVWR